MDKYAMLMIVVAFEIFGTTKSQTDIDTRPAAHLLGSMNRIDNLPAVPGGQYAIPHWIWNADLAFVNNAEYRFGRIIVPSGGLYYIYSQVAFLEDYGSGRTDGSVANTLSHYLYRYNIIYPNGGEEKLTQNSVSKCLSSNNQFAEYTSYLGALFQLRRADEIFVKVSNLSLVARDPKLNYFGLFKL